MLTLEVVVVVYTTEKGEDAAGGVVREVSEELGLTNARINRFIGVYDFKRLNQVILVWHIYASGPIVIPPNEIQAYKRVPIAKLRAWEVGTGPAGTKAAALEPRPRTALTVLCCMCDV